MNYLKSRTAVAALKNNKKKKKRKQEKKKETTTHNEGEGSKEGRISIMYII